MSATTRLTWERLRAEENTRYDAIRELREVGRSAEAELVAQGCLMPNFILRDIEEQFWRRVKAKAALEGITVKALIVKLLTAWLGIVLIAVLTSTPLIAADQIHPRLATVRKAFVVPVDELGDDKGVATCLANHLKDLTPIEAVATREEADVIFRVSSHLPSTTTKVFAGPMGGSPSAHLFVELPDGTKLWDDGAKYRRSMMRQGSFGSSSSDTGKGIECGLADELANTLRDAMRKARDKK